jgi:hypothetical protein
MMQYLGGRRSGVPTMFDENLARIRAHRNNIHRYRNLLRTKLSDLERDFIGTRMTDELASFDALIAATFPVMFPVPRGASPIASDVEVAHERP